MSSSEAIARARLAQERLAIKDTIDKRRAAEQSRLTLLGLGNSSALAESLVRIDSEGALSIVENFLGAILPRLREIEDEESLNEWKRAAEVELETLVKEEVASMRDRATSQVRAASIPLAVVEPVLSSEEARCSNFWRKRIDGSVARRQLELHPVYFPEGVEFAEYSKQRMFVIDGAELGSAEEVDYLIDLMYDASDALFYVFTEATKAMPRPLEDAKRTAIIQVTQTESRHFRHPRFKADWVGIETPHYDWEREVLESGAAEYHRHTLELSPRARAEIAAKRMVAGPSLAVVVPHLWILEDQIGSRQGTAFSMSGIGILTCNHVVLGSVEARKPSDPTAHVTKVVRRGPLSDLAVIDIANAGPAAGLQAAASEPRIGDRIWVAGFPNYRPGDSGVVHHGSVTGTRVQDGLRRLLVSAPIVAGMSGSPVLNDRGKVVGVAVTGADRMEHAPETEHHGVIPLDALRDLI